VIKNLAFLGALLPILGPPRTALLIVPIPCRENHSLKIGDATIGVQAETSDETAACCRRCSCRWRRFHLGSPITRAGMDLSYICFRVASIARRQQRARERPPNATRAPETLAHNHGPAGGTTERCRLILQRTSDCPRPDFEPILGLTHS